MPWNDPKDRYRPGHYKQIDDRTGFEIRAPFSAREWTGLVVRDGTQDPKHPQEYVRGVRDYQAPPDPSPEPNDTFLSPNQITADDL